MTGNGTVPVVLVADDEPDILDLVRMVLEEEGYEVLTAVDGAQALRMANEKRPDLCVLDVMMPEIDGYDVARVLKRDEELRRIPVILLTARTEPENVARGREAGVDEYIAKPFLPDEFQHAVRDVLAAQAEATRAEAGAVEVHGAEGNGAVEPEPQIEVEHAPARAGGRVLLAGANQALINVASYRLELGGYEVITAPDAAAGIELAVELVPDVFVLDASLPNVDPQAVAEALHSKAGRTALVTLANGGPFDPQELFTRIESALARR